MAVKRRRYKNAKDIKHIIDEQDKTAIYLDRENPVRGELIASFGFHVEKIADAGLKKHMKDWLGESYDYAAEISDTLEAVPEDQRFPCMFLDPTIDFAPVGKKDQQSDDNDEEDDRPVTSFHREELLEISRSCDRRVLLRLGSVLTRITYVESSAELPPRIAAMSNADIPKIPLVLASKEFEWKFWKILLHIVLPGTILSARPAVVLAALAIRTGLRPLFKPACAPMLFWRDK